MKEITEQEQVRSFIYGLQVILKGYREGLDKINSGAIDTENVKDFIDVMIGYIETRKQNIKFLN